MWVVKVGGSLQSSPCLEGCLQVLVREGAGTAVVVPGGGEFADRVRRSQQVLGLDDAAAHRLAVRAMEEYARLLCAIEPRLIPAASEADIRGALVAGHVPIWLASRMVNGAPEIPEDWSVSSDSLALWLARLLRADSLLLIKSVEPPEESDAEALAAAGYVDAAFPHFLRGFEGTLEFLPASRLDGLAALLNHVGRDSSRRMKRRGPAPGPRLRNKKARHPEEAGGAGQ